MTGITAVDPPANDQEAKDVLSAAYQELFGVDESEVNLFALGIAQAVGLMEGSYGKWGPGNSSNNWGAITASGFKDGKCPPGTFIHGDSSFEAGEYQTCFRLYETSLDGAIDLLNELYVKRPAVHQAAVNGDIRGVAQEMYATSYYMGTSPHNFSNVNKYIAFIGRGIDQIADLYPSGESSVADSGNSNTGLIIGLGVAAVAIFAVVNS